MKGCLYLPSTPLNILLASAYALEHAQQSKQKIWLIDQKKIEHNEYFLALKQWKTSPFSEVEIFPGQASGLKKIKERTANFKKIKTLLQNDCPALVGAGSDRRIEFQYVLHLLAMQNPSVEGLYLDDGLYTYAGRQHHWLKDGISSLLKKISYGFWWEEPITIGASSKISQAWLFLPEMALKSITHHKKVSMIQPRVFQSTEMNELTRRVMEQFGEQVESYAELDVLLFLPHPNNAKRMPGYAQKIQETIKRFVSQGRNVAIKYHPRVGQGDPFNLMPLGVAKCISAGLASEFLLPILSKKCHVIGDVGTALLTCHWLRPDLTLTAVLSSEDTFQARFIPLMKNMGISIVSDLQKVLK